MDVAQEVDHVLGHVDEEQRDDGVELLVLGEHFQKIALDELDSLVWPVIRHCYCRVASVGVRLMRPFGHKWMQGVLI